MQPAATSEKKGPADARRVVGLDEWQRRLDQLHLTKSDLDKLVMNYLVIEGYKDAAERFSREIGLRPSNIVDMAAIEDRMRIRNAIQSGRLEEAMERINTLNPEILDCNPRLFFHLLQQQLIELIRAGDVQAALEFAQEELAPRGEESPELLVELERTMALLVFAGGENGGDGKTSEAMDSLTKDLFDPFQRIKTANEVNAALLAAQCQEKESKLPSILRFLEWTQGQLDERLVYPKITDFAKAALDPPKPTAVVGSNNASLNR